MFSINLEDLIKSLGCEDINVNLPINVIKNLIIESLNNMRDKLIQLGHLDAAKETESLLLIINSYINGSYTLKVVCDDEVSNDIESFLKELPDKLILLPEIYNVINELPSDEAESFLKKTINDVESYYRDLFKGLKIEQFKTHTKMVEELRQVYKKNYFSF